MNGILLAAACLGALVTITLSEPKLQELQHAQRLEQTALLTSQRAPNVPENTSSTKGSPIRAADKGSMTTKTVVDVDRSGKETVTEERVIAFQD